MVNQAELAELIDRSPAAVSQATKEGHLCARYPIAEWVEWTPSGRVKGYHVPADVLTDLQRDEANEQQTGKAPVDEASTNRASTDRTSTDKMSTDRARSRRSANADATGPRGDGAMTGTDAFWLALSGRNVSGQDSNEPDSNEQAVPAPRPTGERTLHSLSRSRVQSRRRLQESGERKTDAPAPEIETPAATRTQSHGTNAATEESKTLSRLAQGPIDASSRTSVLPEDQDYFRSVAAGSTAHVLASIAQSDTSTARALTTAIGVASGATLGYYVTDEKPVGALIGGGLMFLAVMYGFNPERFEF